MFPSQFFAAATREDSADVAPWSWRDTLIGVLATLVPLLLLDLLNFLASNTTSGATPKLTPQLDTVTAIVTFVLTAVLEGVFLIAPLYYALKRAGGRGLRALGIRGFSIGLALGMILLSIVGVIITEIVYSAVTTALHINVQTNIDPLIQELKNAPRTVYATLIAAVVVAPICEELFFRGFLLQGLRKVMPASWSVIVSSLVFAVAHVSPGSFVLLFVLALFLGWMRVATKSIWPGVILHTLNNSLALLSVLFPNFLR